MLNFVIFKLGGSHENDVTNDMTFTYAVPKPFAWRAPSAIPRRRRS